MGIHGQQWEKAGQGSECCPQRLWKTTYRRQSDENRRPILSAAHVPSQYLADSERSAADGALNFFARTPGFSVTISQQTARSGPKFRRKAANGRGFARNRHSIPARTQLLPMHSHETGQSAAPGPCSPKTPRTEVTARRPEQYARARCVRVRVRGARSSRGAARPSMTRLRSATRTAAEHGRTTCPAELST